MNQATRLQAHHTAQMSLPLSFDLSISPSASTVFSAPSKGILKQEADYLCRWLRSRLEDGLWLPREESSLIATRRDRAQVMRLAHKARALGLSVWPPRAQRQEVA